MKDQVLRILRMVREGKLSPDDALELLDAFLHFDRLEAEAQGEGATTKEERGRAFSEDPFRRLVDTIEKLTREAVEAVNWAEVAGTVRQAASKGVETLRSTVEQITKGEFTWFGPQETVTVELPLRMEGRKTLKVESHLGDVRITGGSAEGRLVAKAVIRGKTREDLRVKRAGWTPVIELFEEGATIKPSPDAVEEDLEIEVPEGVMVDVVTEAGDVSIKYTRAGVRCVARSGDVEVVEAQGSVQVESQAGDVRVEKLSGSLEVDNKVGDVWLREVSGVIHVRSATGDVRGRDLSGSVISVETANGDVDLDLCEPLSGTLNVRTVSGDVLVDLAGGSHCRVALSSINGSVRCAIPLEEAHHSEGRITGRIGSGEGTVDVSAVNGNVVLSLRDEQG